MPPTSLPQEFAPAQQSIPITSAATETILHDLFVVGIGAAALFIKNPNSQAKAGIIISILQSLLPHMEVANANRNSGTS